MRRVRSDHSAGCTATSPSALVWIAASALVGAAGCATIPAGQYGVTDIDWVGVEAMDPDAIEACLVTRQREAVVLRLGLGGATCGTPPFDSSAPKVTLWTNPWVEWPLYDPAIFDIDTQRVERWYRARGFYDARVLGVRAYVDGHLVGDPIECDQEKSSCKLEVVVRVEEGEPVAVQNVQLVSNVTLPPQLLEKIADELEVKRGQRFDESAYEDDKKKIQELLWDASYARAKVAGKVTVDRDKRTADVVYMLEPGPSCVFGKVVVAGIEDADIPALLIIQAANIPEGEPYSYERVLDAEQAVFALDVFSSVTLKPEGEGEVVDLVATVRVGRLVRWGAGIGIMSGTLRRSFSTEAQSIPQWDIHLSGSWEHRNFLGGLRRLRIEERPRMIFLDDFPGAKGGPRPGNVLRVDFEQPATFERRTNLFVENTWDFGPDSYQGFFRHDLSDKIGLERAFLRQRLQVRVAAAHDLFEITDSERPDDVSSYRLPFLEQQIILDLRNNPTRPRYGAYFSVATQEAFEIAGYGSWNYFRVTPDVRGYVPLMWDFVLAARFALGALFISDADASLDGTSRRLGPQSYRLRGGGANSNRGFSAGRLGGIQGGIRRYEGSLELRIPFGSDFGAVLFGDIADVNQGRTFRFKHLNAAAGFGLRFFTILGAIRFDAGWRIPSLQIPGDEAAAARTKVEVWPSAAHLTIGEAF